MKNLFKIFAAFILLIAAVFPSSTSASGNLVNGGFETGDFTNWSVPTPADSANVVAADGYTTPNQGTYMARLGTPQFSGQPAGDNIIYQDFVASDPNLSFVYNIFTYDYSPFNHFHYTLTDLDSNTVITSYSQTAWDAGTELKSTGWQTVSLDIAPHLGKNLRLEIDVAGTNDSFYATWAYVDSADSGPTNDTTPPITTATIDGTLGNNGWYRSDITISLNPTDDNSGVEKTEYSFDNVSWNLYSSPIVVSTEGERTIYYKSTDNAGNVESTKSQSYKVDKTAPIITIEEPLNGAEPSYLLNQNVLASWSVEDPISNVSSVISTKENGEPLDTSSVGQKALTVSAQDFAGNESSETSIYFVQYNYCGFSQPINSDGSSVFKFGNTVPVKFCITDANGNDVEDAVAEINLVQISGDVLGTEIEATSTSAATTGNLFRYDPTDGQYIFNLATKNLSKGTWRITIYLGDGTESSVNISLK